MEYKLLGFSEHGSVRRFIFKKAGNPADPPFTVIANVGIARKFNVPLQDLPSLCARLLEAGGEEQTATTVFVTDADLTFRAAAISAAAQEVELKRAIRSSRSKLAAEAAKEKNAIAARSQSSSPASESLVST